MKPRKIEHLLHNGVNNKQQLQGISTSNGISKARDTIIPCDWLTDTFLDGNKFIVELTDEELSSLGFLLDSSGIYYYNLFNKDSLFFHSMWENGHGEYSRVNSLRMRYNKKKVPSNHSFYPLFMSSPDYKSYDFEQEDFNIVNDTLLPIYISGRQLNKIDGVLLWFKITDELFYVLPPRYSHLIEAFKKIKSQKMVYEDIDIVKYEYINPIDGLELIELNKEQLIKIGFEFKKEEIVAKSYGECFWEISLIKGGQKVRHNPNLENSIKISNVVFLSNMFGQQSIRWKCTNENTDKWKYGYFVDNIPELLPILLKKEIAPELIMEDQIFWLIPNQGLFDALPKEIGEQLKKEFNYIQAREKGVEVIEVPSCTYFEACKSTLQLDDLSIYPNPADQTVNIDFSLDEAIDGRISLVNISGAIIKNIVPHNVHFWTEFVCCKPI